MLARIGDWIEDKNKKLNAAMRQPRSKKFGFALCGFLVALSLLLGWGIAKSLPLAFWMGSLALAIFLERLSSSRYTLLSIPSTVLAFGGIGGIAIRAGEEFSMLWWLWVLWGISVIAVIARVVWNFRHFDDEYGGS